MYPGRTVNSGGIGTLVQDPGRTVGIEAQQTSNPLIARFQTYVGENGHVPFQGNHLLRSNPQAQANLNTTMQQYRYQQSNPLSTATVNSKEADRISEAQSSNVDILTQMLRPQKITTDNADVMSNLKERERLQEEARFSKSPMFAYTAVQYKPIIKDKPIVKPINQIQVQDLIVHTVDKTIDADVEVFAASVKQKETEKDTHNRELEVEYSTENYSKNKEKFTFQSDCVRRVNYEGSTAQDIKEDSIEFYKKKQIEAEIGQKNCDDILRYLESKDIIDDSEF
jgi:hypothetical protein